MSGCLLMLRDALARLVRIDEALEDADSDFARAVLDDLRADLWLEIERLEREEQAR